MVYVIQTAFEQQAEPKHVEFHFQNKFEKLVYLAGFIVREMWQFV
jgi:hypothetical protein